MWNKRLKVLVWVLLPVLVGLCLVAWFLPEREPEKPTVQESTQDTSVSTTQTTAPTVQTTVPTVPPTVSTEPVELVLDCEAGENNVFTLTWNEIPGERFLVEISTDGAAWETLAEVTEDESYTTGHLGAFESYSLRVTATESGAFDECSVTTTQRVIYSTVWPLVDLKVYEDAEGKKSLGTAPAGTAYCVLEEKEGLFAIRFGEKTGYISSDYCMINLPEYVGDLCAYDIANSYSAIYRVHELDIKKVTGTVIAGYEDVQQTDGYLVPLLYPAAKKLVTAALTAWEQGYQLKIYDSFRPHKATKSIYSLTGKIVDDTVPGEDYTYRELMTDDGRYRLSNFLAPVVSRHNVGVALDLTLQTLDGEELQMQSTIHDLSWFSALECNNENADLLQDMMVAAGFATLKSEWWHFQDAEAYDRLKLEYLNDGVSAQCWVKDDTGWRYRRADGTYLTDCHEVIDEICYVFDGEGYVSSMVLDE